MKWRSAALLLPLLMAMVNALLPCGDAWGRATAPAELDLSSSPRPDEPLPMRVGLYVQDFNGVDERENVYEVEGLLFVSWNDGRLRGNARTRHPPGAIWMPQLLIENAQDDRRSTDILVETEADGTVRYQERFVARLNSQMDIRKFPFDSQTIHLLLRQDRGDSQPLRLTTDRTTSGLAPDAFLVGWNIGGLACANRITPFSLRQRTHQLLDFQIHVSRQWFAYLPSVLLPMTLILFMSWTVFWSRSFEANVVIVCSALLCHIAYNVYLAGEVPRSASLTYTDAVVFCNYVLYFVVLIAIVANHYLEIAERQDVAAKLGRVWRWACPVLFAVANAGLALVFLAP